MVSWYIVHPLFTPRRAGKTKGRHGIAAGNRRTACGDLAYVLRPALDAKLMGAALRLLIVSQQACQLSWQIFQ
jgi:hypothetical protein